MYGVPIIPVLVLVFCIILVLIGFSFETCNLRKRTRFMQDTMSTIFVMVPCYRDAECPATLNSIFSNAQYPQRITVGLCVQNKEGDVECPNEVHKNANIRTITLDHKNAKGPCYARFLISTLYRDEDYVLSVDCHTNFVQGWDTLCIKMLKECPDPAKSVLTTHPPKQYKDPSTKRTTHICKGKFSGNTVSFSSIEVSAQKKNMKTPFIGWGFIFMPGSTLKTVPLDPNLDFLFEGEELLYAIRLWTFGYNAYSPRVSVCTHAYERKNQPSVYIDVPNWKPKQDKSIEKITDILKGKNIECYGIGKDRTVKSYLSYAKVDLENKTIGDHCVA